MRSAKLVWAISAVATHQIAHTKATGRVNRPKRIANPPPSSTTTAKTHAASTIGRLYLASIACAAAGPVSLPQPPKMNSRLIRMRPSNVAVFSLPCMARPALDLRHPTSNSGG
jgi:hypothetical protein